jgi:hypothetical protein
MLTHSLKATAFKPLPLNINPGFKMCLSNFILRRYTAERRAAAAASSPAAAAAAASAHAVAAAVNRLSRRAVETLDADESLKLLGELIGLVAGGAEVRGELERRDREARRMRSEWADEERAAREAAAARGKARAKVAEAAAEDDVAAAVEATAAAQRALDVANRALKEAYTARTSEGAALASARASQALARAKASVGGCTQLTPPVVFNSVDTARCIQFS